MDEVIEVVTELFDDVRDLNARKLVVKGREFIQGHGRSKFLEGVGGPAAKKANKVPLVVKGADIVIDRLGIDPDNAVRNRLGRYTGPLSAGDILPPDDVAQGGAGAQDSGSAPPAADRMLTGQIDP